MILKGKVAGTSSGHYISLDDEKAEKALKAFGKRVKCSVNDRSIHCAIQFNKRIGYFISAGKTTRNKLRIEGGQELLLKIQADSSEFQMEMPEVLHEVLISDSESFNRFQQLTPGKKRSIMHYVGKAKNVETQINRALKVMDNLKMGKTDLKQLIR